MPATAVQLRVTVVPPTVLETVGAAAPAIVTTSLSGGSVNLPTKSTGATQNVRAPIQLLAAVIGTVKLVLCVLASSVDVA